MRHNARQSDNNIICNYREYPKLPQGNDLTPPLWKFQASYITDIKFFGLPEPPTTPSPQKKIPSMGGNIGIFWICAVKISLKGLPHGILSYLYHQQNYL